jgi:hypothetical protein
VWLLELSRQVHINRPVSQMANVQQVIFALPTGTNLCSSRNSKWTSTTYPKDSQAVILVY